MKKLLLLLLILAIPIFIYFFVFNQQSALENKQSDWVEKEVEHAAPAGGWEMGNNIYQCSVDDDCTLVSVGKCCEFVAVNKNFKDEIKPTPMICTRVCYVAATCKKGICWATETK